MDIQILKLGPMVNAGHFVLRALPKGLSIVDLLVRESVQNSLDAGIGVPGDRVNVDFIIDSFDKAALNSHLECVGDILDTRFSDDEYDFIAVKDSGTTGLTGKLRLDDITSQNKGNLYKLVYAIGENQTGPGSGGAWGLGKTIFYQLGIGLVLYYSRIYDNEAGKYESRLVACMIEDETKPDSLIPAADGIHKSGIAWWGVRTDPSKVDTVALTDEDKINSILEIFNLSPYEDTETGTTVIVPYIDKERLLNSLWTDDGTNKPYWRSDLGDYITTAVERWYFPRLDNSLYRYGKYLAVSVNSSEIRNDEDMPKVFRAMQALYNRGAHPEKDDFDDFLSQNQIEANIDPININKVLCSPISGYVASAKLSKKVLGMTPPDNQYEPFVYFDEKRLSMDTNSPLLAYTRKPGMVVAYVQKDGKDGAWLQNVQSTDNESYILALYVLNSDNKMTIDKPLEEYARFVEESDHNLWRDKTYEGHDYNIIERIKRNTSNALKNRWNPKPPERQHDGNDGGHSASLGSLLMPKGKGPSGKPTERGGGGNGKKKDFSARLRKTDFINGGISLLYEVKVNAKVTGFEASVNISSEAGDITPSEWEENMQLDMPFSLDAAVVSTDSIGGKPVSIPKVSLDLNEGKEVLDTDLGNYRLEYTRNGYGYGLKISGMQPQDYILSIRLTLSLTSRDIIPHVIFNKL